jgi:hypothetical protein
LPLHPADNEKVPEQPGVSTSCVKHKRTNESIITSCTNFTKKRSRWRRLAFFILAYWPVVVEHLLNSANLLLWRMSGNTNTARENHTRYSGRCHWCLKIASAQLLYQLLWRHSSEFNGSCIGGSYELERWNT